jgi:hypothetical protein
MGSLLGSSCNVAPAMVASKLNVLAKKQVAITLCQYASNMQIVGHYALGVLVLRCGCL